MSLCFAFRIVVSASAASKVIHRLLEMSPKAIPDEVLGEKPSCLELEFKVDDAIVGYLQESNPTLKVSTGDLAAIGCLYTRVEMGDEYALISCEAATGSISRLLENSTSIKETFLRLVCEVDGARLFFDDEQGEVWRLLVPLERMVSRPPIDDFCDWPSGHLDVDKYCKQCLVTAQAAI